MTKRILRAKTPVHTKKPLRLLLATAVLACSTLACVRKPLVIPIEPTSKMEPLKPVVEPVPEKRQKSADQKLAELFSPVVEALSSNLPVSTRLRMAFEELKKIGMAGIGKESGLTEKIKFAWLVLRSAEVLQGMAENLKMLGEEDITVYLEIGKLSPYFLNELGLAEGDFWVRYNHIYDFNSLLDSNWDSEEFSVLSRFMDRTAIFRSTIRAFACVKIRDTSTYTRSLGGKRSEHFDEDESPYNRLFNALADAFNEIKKAQEAWRVPTSHPLLGKLFPWEKVVAMPSEWKRLEGMDINPFREEGKVRLKPPFQKPVVVSMWAYWCGPCKREMPWLDLLHQSGDVIVVGYHAGYDYIDRRELHTRTQNGEVPPVHYPLVMLSIRWAIGNVHTLPMTLILDKKGVVRRIIRGETTEAELRSFISSLY